MKTILKNIIILAALASFTFLSFGQAIQVNCDDNIGLGTAPNSSNRLKVSGSSWFNTYVGIGCPPVSPYKLKVYGNALIDDSDVSLQVYNEKIIFDHDDADYSIRYSDYDDESIFYPAANNTGYIGRSGFQFYEIRGYRIYADGTQLTSDGRLKENIRTLDSPLEKIMDVRGIKYDFISDQDSISDESKRNEMDMRDKDRIGFIAQELIEVYPELVEYDENNDQYSVDYNGMIPILVEAIKEQQGMIESLQAEINAGNLKSSSALTNVAELPLVSSSTLYQNNPNPFNEDTEIRFEISEDVITSTLIVYDMQGTQIRSYNIPERGKSSVTIYGYDLDPGMYMYTLIADGKEVGTKRMILTD